MINFEKSFRIATDFPLIIDNYKVLYFDEEPILFSGTNKYGNTIIGSSVDEEPDELTMRFFHSIVDAGTYNSFLQRKISYLSVLQNSQAIYVVDKSFDQRDISVSVINYEDIPTEYLPSSDSLCPQQEITPSLAYVLSMKGKWADRYSASPFELGKIQNSFADLLSHPIKALKEFKLVLDVAIHAATPSHLYQQGSFKINFQVDLAQQTDLFMNADMFSTYYQKYINYCLNHLPDEGTKLFDIGQQPSVSLTEVLDECRKLYDQVNIKQPDDLRSLITKKIVDSADDLVEISETIGDHFTYIELSNLSAEIENQVGLIDEIYKKQIIQTVDTIEETTHGKTVIDKHPEQYEVLIYHLNTDSRIGNAYIENPANKTQIFKPRIKILGTDALEETKYTKSLYAGEKIKIKGIARRAGEKFKNIDIIFDE